MSESIDAARVHIAAELSDRFDTHVSPKTVRVTLTSEGYVEAAPSESWEDALMGGESA